MANCPILKYVGVWFSNTFIACLVEIIIGILVQVWNTFSGEFGFNNWFIDVVELYCMSKYKDVGTIYEYTDFLSDIATGNLIDLEDSENLTNIQNSIPDTNKLAMIACEKYNPPDKVVDLPKVNKVTKYDNFTDLGDCAFENVNHFIAVDVANVKGGCITDLPSESENHRVEINYSYRVVTDVLEAIDYVTDDDTSYDTAIISANENGTVIDISMNDKVGESDSCTTGREDTLKSGNYITDHYIPNKEEGNDVDVPNASKKYGVRDYDSHKVVCDYTPETVNNITDDGHEYKNAVDQRNESDDVREYDKFTVVVDNSLEVADYVNVDAILYSDYEIIQDTDEETSDFFIRSSSVPFGMSESERQIRTLIQLESTSNITAESIQNPTEGLNDEYYLENRRVNDDNLCLEQSLTIFDSDVDQESSTSSNTYEENNENVQSIIDFQEPLPKKVKSKISRWRKLKNFFKSQKTLDEVKYPCKKFENLSQKCKGFQCETKFKRKKLKFL